MKKAPRMKCSLLPKLNYIPKPVLSQIYKLSYFAINDP